MARDSKALPHADSADEAAESTLAISGDCAPAHLRQASVEVVAGADAGLHIELQGSTCCVGTSPDCDLVLTDDFVSRRHLELIPEERVVRIVDLGSLNGSYVGAARIHSISAAEDLSLQLGGSTLRLSFAANDLEFPVSSKERFGNALGKSSRMRAVFALLERASQNDVTVLLEGASGTGKDVLATSLHAQSRRAEGPFVVVDCGSIPENLIESELFGHKRGAFTGAAESRAGAFAQARGGTLFLDEIGELPLALQPKLLRVLDSKTYRPVGGNTTESTDVRIVAATNRRLAEAVRQGQFREDLFYRLNVVHVRVPALSERRDDIPMLASEFLRRATGNPAAELPSGLERLLVAHDWPGNARELRNVMDRFATFETTNPQLLFGQVRGRPAEPEPADPFARLITLDYHEAKRQLLDAMHRSLLPKVVEQCGGSISEAAKRLGLPRTSLHRMLKHLDD